ncbi:UDP-N-acetylmuramate dehydrogenase [Chiayiivirga flava]|uniref:UDP-N-acetylenolpyruvoylglucosamine reductase n=1 Tax=Chiayiivirga flava TaxID=659595 RepID=A0A7W8D556_9GAMM|nr:UDP-N-acetylmuramate dehydrogenase [Chiayiivirga flava]
MSAAFSLTERAPLAGRNGFRLPARAELLADVRRADGLAELLAYPYVRRAPVMVLGEGSNVLFADDVPGLVVSLEKMLGRHVLAHDGDTVLVRAAAGERWDDLVRWSVGHGFCGLENMSLIPGTVGASPIQNIGAYGAEIAEFVETVEAWDREAGALVRLANRQCAFGYRDSLFKRERERWIVTAVELRLSRVRALRYDYPGLPEELAAMGVDTPRASHVAEAVARLRTRKLPNPALLPNVGSFFKNPVVDATCADRLLREHPSMPNFPGPDAAQRKLSAAWLIEQCGWKGFRDGDAGVAAQHALVLVNHGNATGAQLLDLARRIAASVRERFGVTLEPEARIVGAVF